MATQTKGLVPAVSIHYLSLWGNDTAQKKNYKTKKNIEKNCIFAEK